MEFVSKNALNIFFKPFALRFFVSSVFLNGEDKERYFVTICQYTDTGTLCPLFISDFSFSQQCALKRLETTLKGITVKGNISSSAFQKGATPVLTPAMITKIVSYLKTSQEIRTYDEGWADRLAA